MITKALASCTSIFYHRSLRNADGTALRCRANGKLKVWKTRPDDFRLPVKYGLKQCFYITPRNAREWLTYDPSTIYQTLGLAPTAPREVCHDKALDMDRPDLAALFA